MFTTIRTTNGWGELHTSKFNISPDFGVAAIVHFSHQEGAEAVSLLSGGRRELSTEDLCHCRRTS